MPHLHADADMAEAVSILSNIPARSTHPLATARASQPRRSPLAEELALMNCTISLTMIPEFEYPADDGKALVGQNLFGPVMDDADICAAVNFMRTSRRSTAAQRRVVALRRRAMRAQVRRPASLGQSATELRTLRDHIYHADPSDTETNPSVPLRLATHAIGLSLVVTALPVGAAMMTYNLLKGEDIRATARLTTLTGLALAIIAGNPGLAHLIGA